VGAEKGPTELWLIRHAAVSYFETLQKIKKTVLMRTRKYEHITPVFWFLPGSQRALALQIM